MAPLRLALALFAASVAAEAAGMQATIEGRWLDEQTKRTYTIARAGDGWTVSGFVSPSVVVTRAHERYIFLAYQATPKRREEFALTLTEDGQSLRGHYTVLFDLGGTETHGSSPIHWHRVQAADAGREPAPDATDDGRFAALPQFALLKSKIYQTVGAKGYVVNTDARGQVVRTTDATDYTIRDIRFDPKTKTAAVVLVSSNHTLVVKQEWRHAQDDWRPNDPDSGINKLK